MAFFRRCADAGAMPNDASDLKSPVLHRANAGAENLPSAGIN
jgi:hypothetical protein